MGSIAKNKLPVIDLSVKNLNSSSSCWDDAKCAEVTRALEEFGCFIATYDGVSQQLRDAIFVGSQDLFDLPTQVKMLNTSETPYNGYIGQQPMVPLYESLGIDSVTTTEGVERFTKLMWPSGNQSFSESALMYSKAAAELDQIVMRMVAKSYGVEEDYETLLGSTNYLLKLMKYLSPKGNGDQGKDMGILPHTDKSFTTVLCQDEVNGLEIKAKDSDEWIEVYPTPSSFVVMAGDACMAWTNGRIESASHRVMMSGTKERYSLGLFAFIRDRMIGVPQKLVDEDHPLQFEPFDNYKYMNYFYTLEGRRSKCAIKSYCGI